MKILVFGSTGMLGHTLIKYLQTKKSLSVEFTIREESKQDTCKRIFGKNAKFIVNANNPDSALIAIKKYKPDYCINCLGLIKQKDESNNFLKSININSLLPHLLSKYCAQYNSKLIHISTDCVYSGREGNYSEENIPDPIDFYGKSKLLGEVSNKNAITIRTSIIGPEINSSKGLFEWFRSSKDIVYGYSNAWFSGFPTIELSRIIYKYMIKKKLEHDVYNLSSKPINKMNLLNLINEVYDFNKIILEEKSVKIDRTLDCSKFISKTGFVKDEWLTMLKRMKRFG